MSLNIKKVNDIWTIELNEKFAFESFEEMIKCFETLIKIKKENGNFIQLMKKKKEERDKKEFEEAVKPIKDFGDVLVHVKNAVEEKKKEKENKESK